MVQAGARSEIVKQRDRSMNWLECDQTLGRLTVWFDQASILDGWKHMGPKGQGKPGLFSDPAIQTSLTVKIPLGPRNGLMHVVVDFTGLKIFGEGEWGKRAATALASGSPRARSIWPSMRRSAPSVASKSPPPTGAMAASCRRCWNRLKVTLAECLPMAPTTPKIAMRPFPGKVLWPPSHTRKAPCLLGGVHPRDGILYQIATDGMDEWKRQTGHHMLSLVEIASSGPRNLATRSSPDASIAEWPKPTSGW
jgi:hypothetical protein